MGITPIIAQLLGAKKTDSIPTIVYQGFYIATTLALIILLLGVFGLVPLLNFLNFRTCCYGCLYQLFESFRTWPIPSVMG